MCGGRLAVIIVVFLMGQMATAHVVLRFLLFIRNFVPKEACHNAFSVVQKDKV